MPHRPVLRLIAVLLILLAAGELATCETLPMPGPATFSSLDQHGATHWHCLCCCPHVALTRPMVWPGLTTLREARPAPMVEALHDAARALDHPPRS